MCSYMERLNFPSIFEVQEACQVHGKVLQEHGSKPSTKYELEGSYGDPLDEHVRLENFRTCFNSRDFIFLQNPFGLALKLNFNEI